MGDLKKDVMDMMSVPTSDCLPLPPGTTIVDGLLVSVAVCATVAGITASLLLDTVCGTGYVLTGVSTGCLLCTLRELRTSKSIASSAQTLREENDELRVHVDTMELQVADFAAQNSELSKLSDDLTDDLEMLKGAVGAVGAAGRDMMTRLRTIWTRYRDENEHHARLLRAQTRLQILQIMQHFDEDTDATLSEDELSAATAYIRSAFPEANIPRLLRKASQGITFDELLHELQPTTEQSTPS